MTEEDTIFDPSMKKKKKKKKTPFDLDAALLGEGGDSTETDKNEAPTEKPEQNDAPNEEQTEDFSIDDDFSNLTKKKKKKKKPFDLSELDDALPKDDKGEDDNVEKTEDTGMDINEDDFDLSLPSKKKKKKKLKFKIEEGEGKDALDDDQTTGPSEDKAFVDHDRDYTYDELLKRVFDIMREKNPDMVAGEKKRFVMKPPQVMRVGTKKTSFSNFAEICKMLHRQPKHLLAFLLAELGTSGSIDGNNQLIIKGRFQQKQIENVLRRYIKEYVTCHTCRSPETILQKDTRLYFLQCETCGSRCSVASIKSGFQAVTGKRAAIRAKTT